MPCDGGSQHIYIYIFECTVVMLMLLLLYILYSYIILKFEDDVQIYWKYNDINRECVFYM